MNTKQLLEQIDRLYSINAIKNNQTIRDDLNTIRERVKDDTFKIVVTGEFSSGKSTFINALIGMDLLSHAVNETTATITRIHNVQKNDNRLGSCVIKYRNGEEITVDDMEKLHDYTTTQSSQDVANTILGVSVYVHFMDAAYPIEIIDTPGLNGIADKHREITIEEVKKAHACIYMLSIKGVTSSDVEFIRILQKYQGRFIFIQNFIDQLNVSEGETVESKLDADRDLITHILENEDIYFDYDVCGISALKKLCARDYNIRKLYSDDLVELTDIERKKIESESRFSDFEKLLMGLAANEKYKEIMVCAAIQSLNALIENVLPNIEKRQKINEELQKQDDRTKRIEKARWIFNQIKANESGHRKKLQNFIISRDQENRRGLKEYSDSLLRGVLDTVCKEIDDRIRSYEDIEEFSLIENKSLFAFYGTKASGLINQNVIPAVDECISDNLSHLYDEALQRVMGYATVFWGNGEKLDIKIQEQQEQFQMSDGDHQAKIYEYKSIIEMKRKEGEEVERKVMSNKQEFEKTKSDLKKAMQEKEEDRRECCRDIENLGSKPDVERNVIRKSKRIKRGGFFGSIADFFDDGKLTYYDDVEFDDTAQREWIKKYNEYTRRQQQQMERHTRKITELNDKKSSLENNIKQGTLRSNRIHGEIEDLEGRIKRETKIYQDTLRQNKKEFCENQKRRLKNSLENQMFGRTGSECTIERLEQHIDKVSDTYIKPISKKIDQHYMDSLKTQIGTLQKLIDENSQGLREEYGVDAKDIAALREIKNHLRRTKDE